MTATARQKPNGKEAAETAGSARFGLESATLSAILTGAACWFAVLPQIAAGERTQTGASGSVLAEVDPAEFPAALATLDPATTVAADARRETKRCGLRLAWVAVVRAPGATPGTVRIMSGGYVSPLFPLPETPARVAIPYPAPYEAGRGTLTLLDAGGGALVALTPAVRAETGSTTNAVTWRPTERCSPTGG